MAGQEVSKSRKVSSRTLFILAIPLVVLGLIDPLEGGLALMAAALVYLGAFLLAGHGPRKILWIPFASAIGIGTVVLAVALFGVDRVGETQPMIPLALGNWIYRGAVLVTLAGAILTAVQPFRPSPKA